MPVRLDQLPRDTQQQILARLREQSLLVREPPRPYVRQEPASDQPSGLRTAALMVGYAMVILGAAVLALVQASGSDMSRSYPVFFARVFVYVARESWAIVRDNAVPLSGNLVIAAVFVLGVWKALELAVLFIRKLWPLLILAEVALAVLQLEAALGKGR
jgi:lysylphosphatidylglycerol synthetase-like protein (DUF2156 family)